MRIAVQDASIIIDQIECGLFERFFRLELEVVTTSLVLGEISQSSQRKACQAAVDVRGILWVFDQFVGSGLLPKREAHTKLSELKKRNQRLPKTEIEKRLKTWGGSE